MGGGEKYISGRSGSDGPCSESIMGEAFSNEWCDGGGSGGGKKTPIVCGDGSGSFPVARCVIMSR